MLVQGNDFKGYGPRLGIAGDLNLGCGFSLVALVGTDLLIGKIDTLSQEINAVGESATLNPDRRKRLVPALDAKFGVAATVPLHCSQVSVELGYQVEHYFNAKDSLRFTDLGAVFNKQDQDIDLNGPYIRLQVNF